MATHLVDLDEAGLYFEFQSPFILLSDSYALTFVDLLVNITPESIMLHARVRHRSLDQLLIAAIVTIVK